MFIGHFGLSFAAKKAAPALSLGALFIATQFADLLWPFLILFDVEKVAIVAGHTKTNAFDFLYYPYSHSLLMAIAWGAVVGLIWWLVSRNLRSAVVIALCVCSHWFLDLIVHVPDLPLTLFTDTKVGFGLWNFVWPTLLLEALIFGSGVYLYVKNTTAKNKIGTWGLAVLCLLLVLFQISGLVTPPPSPQDSLNGMMGSLLVLMVLIVSLAYWVDKNRTAAHSKDN